MSTTPTPTTTEQRPRRPGGRAAGMVLVLTLAAVAAAWFWVQRQGAMQSEISIVTIAAAGGTAFVGAILTQFRNMSAFEILAAFWELVLGLLWLIGAAIKGFFSAIASLFGWD
jgi:hypothetical protein